MMPLHYVIRASQNPDITSTGRHHSADVVASQHDECKSRNICKQYTDLGLVLLTTGR